MEAWADAFDTKTRVSWRSVPGQLALRSQRVATPPGHLIALGSRPFAVRAVDLDGDGDLDAVGTAGLGMIGTASVSTNDFTLTVDGAVPGQFGLFFYGSRQTDVPFGDGSLCVAGGGRERVQPLRRVAGGVLSLMRSVKRDVVTALAATTSRVRLGLARRVPPERHEPIRGEPSSCS